MGLRCQVHMSAFHPEQCRGTQLVQRSRLKQNGWVPSMLSKLCVCHVKQCEITQRTKLRHEHLNTGYHDHNCRPLLNITNLSIHNKCRSWPRTGQRKHTLVKQHLPTIALFAEGSSSSPQTAASPWCAWCQGSVRRRLRSCQRRRWDVHGSKSSPPKTAHDGPLGHLTHRQDVANLQIS